MELGTFPFPVPLYKADPVGVTLITVIALILALPYIAEISTGIKIEMFKLWHFPCNVGSIKKLLPSAAP